MLKCLPRTLKRSFSVQAPLPSCFQRPSVRFRLSISHSLGTKPRPATAAYRGGVPVKDGDGQVTRTGGEALAVKVVRNVVDKVLMARVDRSNARAGRHGRGSDVLQGTGSGSPKKNRLRVVKRASPLSRSIAASSRVLVRTRRFRGGIAPEDLLQRCSLLSATVLFLSAATSSSATLLHWPWSPSAASSSSLSPSP